MKQNMNKFLILMCYYNRPNLVRFALNSVKQQSYKNWEICFVDDGSEFSAKDIVEEILSEEKDKVYYFNTKHTTEEKKLNGGSIFGLFWTIRCQISDADYGIMLCDDDALVPDYLNNLNMYLQNNEKWCYSHYISYDPYIQNSFHPEKIIAELSCPFITQDVNPDSILDASQVAFSLKAFKNNNVSFGYPLTANLDSDLYRKLFPIYGSCKFNNMYGQFKGKSQNRLEIRQHNSNLFYVNDIDIPNKPNFEIVSEKSAIGLVDNKNSIEDGQI